MTLVSPPGNAEYTESSTQGPGRAAEYLDLNPSHCMAVFGFAVMYSETVMIKHI